MNDKLQLLNRLDRLPIWPYRKFVMLIMGMGFFFAFYDILTIGVALPKITEHFQLSHDLAQFLITIGLIGYIIGAFLDAQIADRFGRKGALMISVIFFSLGSLLSGLSTNIEALIFCRLITGLGLGAELICITSYISELAPAAVRGRASGWVVAYGMFGFVAAPFVALGLVPHFEWGWRYLFILGGVIGVIVIFMRRHIPESPRFLIAKEKFREAAEIIEACENRVAQKLNTILPVVSGVDTALIFQKISFGRLLLNYKGRLLFFIALWFCYYLGNYGWLTLGTTLLDAQGFTLQKSLLFLSIASLGFAVGALLAIFFGDHIERKWLAFMIALIWVAALLGIGWFPYPAVIMVMGFIASTTIAFIIPVLYALTAESFPTPVRATCMSFSDGIGHLGGAFSAQIIFAVYYFFGAMHHGFAMAFTTMAVSGLLTAGLAIFAPLLTKKQIA